MPAPTMKTHGKLAALGAMGVSAGCVAIFAVFIWVTATPPAGGIDFEHGLISRVSIGVIMTALIAVHVTFARQLFAYAKEHESR